MAIPVVIVGRHIQGEIPGCKVVAQRNIEWETDPSECYQQLLELQVEIEREFGLEAGIVFQNVPAILATQLVLLASVKGHMQNDFRPNEMGVVISVPGPRVAGVTESFQFSSSEEAGNVAKAIQFANGRAKVLVEGSSVTVTVDPVSPFVMKGVEWF
jgi:hypothetical protein